MRKNTHAYPIFASFSPNFFWGVKPFSKKCGGQNFFRKNGVGVEMEDQKNGGEEMDDQKMEKGMTGQRPHKTVHPPQGVFGTLPYGIFSKWLKPPNTCYSAK